MISLRSFSVLPSFSSHSGILMIPMLDRSDKALLGAHEFLGDVGGVRKGRKDGMALVSFPFAALEAELAHF